ncbi:hypothetical protein BS50DRAFT_633695 [Corynespora cassiicola Philippines]|uniref:Uncharacterized protein n=1 Tax=Corynespora cassiicola Philippines TaxID=1448308 RepID=A0A2T2NRR3_CORCC|nr:hypothetical protein BS50DRAFT_633695 [Corynespora cassiicola Philippines]
MASSASLDSAAAVAPAQTTAPNHTVPRQPNRLKLKNTFVSDLQDIRNLDFKDRQNLLKGPHVHFIVGDHVAKAYPLRLFEATSMMAEKLLVDGQFVYLPEEIEWQAFLDIFDWLEFVCCRPKAPKLSAKLNMYSDLSLCAASRYAGVDRYTEPIFRWYWAYFSNNIPTYEEISDALLCIQHTNKDPFFRLISKRLATLQHENQIPDPETFALYLASNPDLQAEVTKINQKQERKGELEAARAELRAHAEKRRIQAEEDRIRRLEAEKEREARFAERKRRDKDKWEAQKQKDAALEKSVQEKLRSQGNGQNKKLTLEEARHFEKTRGRRPPRSVF